MQDRINRARQLVAEIHHIPIATVNGDGTPHNSPVFMAFDDSLKGYWASHPANLHSQNIARDAGVFLVIFDSREGHGGLYIKAKATVLEDRAEAARGYQLLKQLKEQLYGSMGNLDDYLAKGTQRIYCASPVSCWVNKSDRDKNGVIIKDNRYEISVKDLLAAR
jgi:hypothetical protein